MSDSVKFEKQVLSGPSKPGLPFSVAVGCGPFVYLSGLVGRDPQSGGIAVGDITAQTEQAMKNLAAQLQKAGTGLERVLKTTVFLVDMNLFAAMNQVYVSYFKGDPPARSCVQVVRLPDPEALVEIELVAVRP